MQPTITFETDLTGVDWAEMKRLLSEDDFDNGRTPQQLRISFEHSFAAVIAYAGDHIIGTARVLSDGICNAYLIDVWTYTPYRRQGVATAMIHLLEELLPGQHIYLQTDHAQPLYRTLGFEDQPTGMGKVIGQWLVNESCR
jgi:GNAT superfamily N-acetyltransferase